MQIELMLRNTEMTGCHTECDRLIGRRLKRNLHARSQQTRIAQGDAYRDLLHVETVMTATAIYPTEIVKAFLASPFNRRDWPFGDYNLALFASVKGTIGYIQISTATWRKMPGSAMNSGFSSILRMDLAAIECRKLFMLHYPVSEEIRRSVMRDANQRAMRSAFYAGDVEQYAQALMRFQEAGGTTNRRLHFFRLFAIRTFAPLAIIRLGKKFILLVTTKML